MLNIHGCYIESDYHTACTSEGRAYKVDTQMIPVKLGMCIASQNTVQSHLFTDSVTFTTISFMKKKFSQ